jgi:Xaa-Pro aminopeptidase
VRTALKDQGVGALVLNALDQIAWLYNLRGSDILCNPVFFAYTVVLADGPATLFVRRPDSKGLKEHLKSQATATHGIELKEYDQFKKALSKIIEQLSIPGRNRVMVEKATCSASMLACIPTPQQHLVEVSPVEVFKSQKNAAEVAGLRSASIKDSLAICKYFSWLELYLLDPAGAPTPPVASTPTLTDALNEFQGAQILSSIRRAGTGCVGDSFPTISATGANAAVIHYQPDRKTSSTIKKDEIYLCDTGGQYTDGTTDITRTLHFGTPSDEQKRCYTRVLQGHVQLAQAVFPAGTCGLMLEMLARQPLWQDGLNYQHGTGHGMGACVQTTLCCQNRCTHGAFGKPCQVVT